MKNNGKVIFISLSLIFVWGLLYYNDLSTVSTKNENTSQFKPLECLPELWGKESPCLIMIRNIN